MKFLNKMSLIFFVFLCIISQVFAVEPRNIIRVGISTQNFATYEHTNLTFVSTSNILVTDMTSDKKFQAPPDTKLKVAVKNGFLNVFVDDKNVIKDVKGSLVLTSAKDIGIVNLNRKGTPAFYSGQFEIKLTKNLKFNAINVLGMQEYLKGVVPNEMPVSFGLEALKAQAVAARNYANRDVNPNPNYDVCDSQASQVYYGTNSHKALSSQAVNETNGIYALYNRQPIVALYFSTSGGITESWEAVFGGANPKIPTKLPYLVSVYDNGKFQKLTTEEDVKRFYSQNHSSNDIKSPKYRWNTVFTQEELENSLPKTLLQLSKSSLVEPKFNQGDAFGTLKDIKVLKRGESGKALLLEVKTDKGQWIVKKELGIRRLLQKNGRILNSANFFIEKGREKEENLTIFDTFAKAKTVYTITGGGFGHGVGMSQYGAGYMAQNGKDFTDILKHYYTGITIGTIPLTVGHGMYDYKITFYYDKKFGVHLKMDNTKRLQNIDFAVNGIEFNPSLSAFSAKTLFFDITDYLKEGNNTITIKPLSGNDLGKTTSVWVEVVK